MTESPSKTDSNDDLSRVDAVALAKMIRDKELSPVEVVSMTIERIERLDKNLNSVIHRQFEKALELAASSCLLYTSPSPRDLSTSRMPSSA